MKIPLHDNGLVQPLRFLAVFVLIFICLNFRQVHAGDESCESELGLKQSETLVSQCLKVSPSAHPPCNEVNRCSLIKDEITRSCELLPDFKGVEFCSDYSKQKDVAVARPARAAQCFLQVNGLNYLGGNCLFTPLDKRGSFRISGGKSLIAEVNVKVDGKVEASWSGPQGGTAPTIDLGTLISDERGCWIGEDGDPPWETHVCAWDKNLRLYLGPTMQEPEPHLNWGERLGMYARITASSGLDTEHAIVTAEKDRDGAVTGCRGNHDYSLHCVEAEMQDGYGLAPTRKTTLQANCKTMKYTDFWGRNLEYSENGIRDLATGQEMGFSTAEGTSVAQTAFEALCPVSAKKAASPR